MERKDVRGEPRLVHAIVDVVVHPLVHFLNVLPQVLRE